MKHILSFDIAKGKSVYCFIDEKRNVIRDATLIEHKKDEFDDLFKYLFISELIVLIIFSFIKPFPFQIRMVFIIYKN